MCSWLKRGEIRVRLWIHKMRARRIVVVCMEIEWVPMGMNPRVRRNNGDQTWGVVGQASFTIPQAGASREYARVHQCSVRHNNRRQTTHGAADARAHIVGSPSRTMKGT